MAKDKSNGPDWLMFGLGIGVAMFVFIAVVTLYAANALPTQATSKPLIFRKSFEAEPSTVLRWDAPTSDCRLTVTVNDRLVSVVLENSVCEGYTAPAPQQPTILMLPPGMLQQGDGDAPSGEHSLERMPSGRSIKAGNSTTVTLH